MDSVCLPPSVLLWASTYYALLVSMHRKVMKKFTFSNGVTVPVGSLVSAPQTSVHHDSVCCPSHASCRDRSCELAGQLPGP